MSNFLAHFRAARRVSTPLIAVRTPDPAATIAGIVKNFNGTAPAVLQWDTVRGIAPVNKPGEEALSLALGGGDPAATANPIEALVLAIRLPSQSVLFFYNAQRFLGEPAVIQAIWNLRDPFKSNQRTLVLMGPDFQLPAELAQDVTVLDEPLPTAPELAAIVLNTHQAAQLEPPDTGTVGKAVDALLGLAAFPAEQVTAMSLKKTGLDMDGLWERKRQLIEQTPGLSVWRGGETFGDIGGCENVKVFLRRVLAGNDRPRAVVFIDEIEKALAGSGGSDTSGVSQGLLMYLLTWMQDHAATGMIFIGPAGAAKSAVAKATGNTAGIPTIALDVAGMKVSLMGESETRMRNALKVVSAVSQGQTLFIATCNSIGVLPPELRRRFTFGTFFFDLPDAEERYAIWQIYCKRYGAGGETPADEGWTGAEIKQCAELAYRLKCSLKEAAAYIVPVSRSAADQVEGLRKQAAGRFIGASKPGVYQYSTITASVNAPAARTLEVE